VGPQLQWHGAVPAPLDSADLATTVSLYVYQHASLAYLAKAYIVHYLNNKIKVYYFNSGDAGHVMQECPYRETRHQQLTCDHCRGKGHLAAVCWQAHPS